MPSNPPLAVYRPSASLLLYTSEALALPLTVLDNEDTVPCNEVSAEFSALPSIVDLRPCAVCSDVTPSALKYDSCLAIFVLLVFACERAFPAVFLASLALDAAVVAAVALANICASILLISLV